MFTRSCSCLTDSTACRLAYLGPSLWWADSSQADVRTGWDVPDCLCCLLIEWTWCSGLGGLVYVLAWPFPCSAFPPHLPIWYQDHNSYQYLTGVLWFLLAWQHNTSVSTVHNSRLHGISEWYYRHFSWQWILKSLSSGMWHLFSG